MLGLTTLISFNFQAYQTANNCSSHQNHIQPNFVGYSGQQQKHSNQPMTANKSNVGPNSGIHNAVVQNSNPIAFLHQMVTLIINVNPEPDANHDFNHFHRCYEIISNFHKFISHSKKIKKYVSMNYVLLNEKMICWIIFNSWKKKMIILCNTSKWTTWTLYIFSIIYETRKIFSNSIVKRSILLDIVTHIRRAIISLTWLLKDTMNKVFFIKIWKCKSVIGIVMILFSLW